jgi:hypothetical protein
VQEFVVGYYNGTLKPNLGEKNQVTGKEIEFLMDGPQFERTKRSDMWSFSTAVGSGYQYRVVYKDRRFSELESLMQMYSGATTATEVDGAEVERRLYDLILVLMREGRVPKTFKMPTPSEPKEDRVAAMLDEFRRTLDELGKRVKQLEDQLEAQKSQGSSNTEPAGTAG